MQDLRIGGPCSFGQYQYTLQGDNLDEISVWANKMQEAMKKISGVADITSDQQTGGLQATVSIDRDKQRQLQIDLASVRHARSAMLLASRRFRRFTNR